MIAMNDTKIEAVDFAANQTEAVVTYQLPIACKRRLPEKNAPAKLNKQKINGIIFAVKPDWSKIKYMRVMFTKKIPVAAIRLTALVFSKMTLPN